jgi:hypothetical protein
MKDDADDVLLPEWSGDFNQTMGLFLDEYRREVARQRRRLALARLSFGLTVASAFFVAGRPLLQTLMG